MPAGGCSATGTTSSTGTTSTATSSTATLAQTGGGIPQGSSLWWALLLLAGVASCLAGLSIGLRKSALMATTKVSR
jgi:hypothetical protein